eukprot:gene11799-35184_t
MGSCCGKPHPLGDNRPVVVENAAFDSVRAATQRCDRCNAKKQFCTCDMRRDTASNARNLQIVRGAAVDRKASAGRNQPKVVGGHAELRNITMAGGGGSSTSNQSNAVEGQAAEPRITAGGGGK